MNTDSESDWLLLRRQAMSALVDGDDTLVDQACRAWRDDAGARADWHAYHLIGEVLRSDDVHCTPQGDAQFLERLRERLTIEPVVLAPAPVLPRASWRRAWIAPAAVAAGFVAVAGVLVVTRVAAPDDRVQDRASLLAGAMSTPASSAMPVALVASGALIRNAELDRYLAAHKQYSSTSALAMPGGGVRNVAATAPGR